MTEVALLLHLQFEGQSGRDEVGAKVLCICSIVYSIEQPKGSTFEL